MQKVHIAFTACLIAALFCGGASAVEDTHSKGGVVTPHISWQPKNGKTGKKILFFSFFNSGVGRYPAEIVQRFGYDYETVYWLHQDGKPLLLGKEEGLGRAEELLRDPEFDAYVFWGASPSVLLGKHQKAYLLLLEQLVRKGKGLVVVDAAHDEKILKDKNRLPAPEFGMLGNGMGRSLFKIGKGTGAHLTNFDRPSLENVNDLYSSHKTISYQEGWREIYEMRLMDVNNLLRHVIGLPVNPVKIQKNQDKLSVIFPDGIPAEALMTLFLAGGGEHAVIAKDIPVKGNRMEFSIPRLPRGRYLAGATIRGKNGSLSLFGSSVVDITSLELLSGIQLKKTSGDTGEQIAGSVIAAPALKTAKLRLRDPERRILEEKNLTFADGKAEFSFTLEEYHPSLLTVEAAVSTENGDSERRYVYVQKTIRRDNKAEIMAWGYNEFAIGSLLTEEQLYHLGITELVRRKSGFSPYPILSMPALGGPLYVPFHRDGQKCFMNPGREDSLKKMYQSLHSDFSHGMKRVLIGDEAPLQIGCLSPYCQTEYRAFLQRKYKTLEALNRAWKTSFTDWAQTGLSMIPERHKGADYVAYVRQVYGNCDAATSCNHAVSTWGNGTVRPGDWNEMLKLYADNPKNRAYYDNSFLETDASSLLSKNYTRWFDRCLYKSEIHEKALGMCNSVLRGIDPHVSAGLSGQGSFIGATDFERICKNSGFWLPYTNLNSNNPVEEIIRVLTPSTYIATTWSGYAKSPAPMLAESWNSFLLRPGMFAIYSVFSTPPAYYGVLRPDLSTTPASGVLLRKISFIRNGFGDLMMNAKPEQDAVRILYSWPSVWASRLEGGDSYPFQNLSHTWVHQALKANGRSFRYISAERLDTGKDSLDGIKLLILPRTDAMSEKTADTIESFVRKGGTVAADVRCGLFTDNMVLRNGGRLDTLFGVRRTAPAAPRKTLLSKEIKVNGDPSVSAADGKAALQNDGIPFLIRRKSGAGEAILLNFDFASLPRPDVADTVKNPASELFAELCEKIPAPLKIQTQNGKADALTRIYRYRNGDMTIVALHREHGAGETLKIIWNGSPRCLYDMGAKRQYGAGKEWNVNLRAPEPLFLIFSDTALPELKLQAPATAAQGETISLKCMIDGEMRGMRPAVLTLERSGREIPAFRKVLLLNNTPETVVRKIALNETPGAYEWVLNDSLTGKVRRIPFTVKEVRQ